MKYSHTVINAPIYTLLSIQSIHCQYMKSAVSDPLSTHRYNKNGVILSHWICIIICTVKVNHYIGLLNNSALHNLFLCMQERHYKYINVALTATNWLCAYLELPASALLVQCTHLPVHLKLPHMPRAVSTDSDPVGSNNMWYHMCWLMYIVHTPFDRRRNITY